MPTRNINLTDHYDGFIAEQLASGRYQNASEIIRAALGLLEQKTAENEAKIEALRREVAIGMAEYQRGEYIMLETDEDVERLFAGIYAEIDEESATDSGRL
jgi:antitoxin ParD1/3/4